MYGNSLKNEELKLFYTSLGLLFFILAIFSIIISLYFDLYYKLGFSKVSLEKLNLLRKKNV